MPSSPSPSPSFLLLIFLPPLTLALALPLQLLLFLSLLFLYLFLVSVPISSRFVILVARQESKTKIPKEYLRVRSEGVGAGAVAARVSPALVHIRRAGGTGEARRTRADVRVPGGVARGTVAARLGGAVVHQLALVTAVSGRALAHVGVEGQQLARGAVHAGVGVARVLDGDLAQGGLVSDGALAVEARPRHVQDHVARAAVLAARTRPVAARVQVLAVLAHKLVRTSREGEKAELVSCFTRRFL